MYLEFSLSKCDQSLFQVFLDNNQTSSCRVKSLVQSFENHGLKNNVRPPKEFRDDSEFDTNTMPHVKKKIPPKVPPKPKFGDFPSPSLYDSFDTRNYCQEVDTKGCESIVPSYDLDIPNVSPKLSESSTTLRHRYLPKNVSKKQEYFINGIYFGKLNIP